MDKQTVQEVFLEKAQFARLDKLKAEKCYIKSADIAKEHFGEKTCGICQSVKRTWTCTGYAGKLFWS